MDALSQVSSDAGSQKGARSKKATSSQSSQGSRAATRTSPRKTTARAAEPESYSERERSRKGSKRDSSSHSRASSKGSKDSKRHGSSSSRATVEEKTKSPAHAHPNAVRLEVMGDMTATESARLGKSKERVVKNFDARMKTLKTSAPRVRLSPADLQNVFIEVDVDKDVPLTDCATSTGAKANLIFPSSYDQDW